MVTWTTPSRPARSHWPRASAAALAAAAAATAWTLGDVLGERGRAAAGTLCLVSLMAACSPDLRRVNWRTVGWGAALQIGLALLVLKLEIAGTRPGYALFSALASAGARFLQFTDAGSTFVFGPLADEGRMAEVFGPGNGLVFAFRALPPIIFVSAFFTLLYHYGILQRLVQWMARAMMVLMRTSGAETLSGAANVFIGQTEAPLIVKPFIARMTRSELLAMMSVGMATSAGGMMAAYIAVGAEPIAILTTSVMAAPCALYLSKLLLPEAETPETAGQARVSLERVHVNGIDAVAGGAADGMRLAINVAAMLIAFLAFIALLDFLLGAMIPGLTLARIFAVVFAPVAFLMGVPGAEVAPMADLLGTKLVTNEFVAFVKLGAEYGDALSDRSHLLATFALTGFANVASIGIQIGGIGAMAPERRSELAELGPRALLVGFAATVINACVAGVLI